jgi:hypothetical protein
MPASRADTSGYRQSGVQIKTTSTFRFRIAVAGIAAFFSIGIVSAPAEISVIQSGVGNNSCRLILNFPTGDKAVFIHRWDGVTLNAKTLLESTIQATGGELLITDGYLTPFVSATLSLTDPTTRGLVVQYQGSYTVPYINGVRWNGPDGPIGAEYQFPDNWWHLWVQGPAHIDQSLAWPDPLDPVDLGTSSAWFSCEFSGLADLTLANGAAVGLVYGSADQPSAAQATHPAPNVLYTRILPENQLEITFQTVSGVSYILKSKSDLNAPNWTPVQSIVASSSTTILTVPMTYDPGRRFFRLEISP